MNNQRSTGQSPQTKETQSMSDATSAYREYVDIVRPAESPRANINDLQLVTSTVRLWWLRTKHPLNVVLMRGFFDNVSDLRFRKEDRIEIVADCNGDGPATHGTLVVAAVNKSGGDVTVSLLSRYERAA
jgi:hypothetical protein